MNIQEIAKRYALEHGWTEEEWSQDDPDPAPVVVKTTPVIERFAVCKRNGTDGVYSDWYTVESDIESLEEARAKATEYRQTHPQSQGWNAHVAVIDKNGYGQMVGDYF